MRHTREETFEGCKSLVDCAQIQNQGMSVSTEEVMCLMECGDRAKNVECKELQGGLRWYTSGTVVRAPTMRLDDSEDQTETRCTVQVMSASPLPPISPFICSPFRVQTTCGVGLPLTFPSKNAFPPWANLALRKICSNTGGDASDNAGVPLLKAMLTS